MPDKLKFGLTSTNGGASSYPEALVNLSQAAEAAGFDSLWAGEHIILPDSSTRIPPTHRYLNPLLALTYMAAYTKTIRLGTGVLLLPQHQPLILAKELATLDVLSGGRLMVGVGVGWSEEEYEALDIPYSERGARTDEYLEAMRAIWSEEKPAYHGKYVSFQGVQAYPHPIQQPTPPHLHPASRKRCPLPRTMGNNPRRNPRWSTIKQPPLPSVGYVRACYIWMILSTIKQPPLQKVGADLLCPSPIMNFNKQHR